MIATQLKCRVWNASGVKNVFSEALRKFCVCVWSKMMFLTLSRQGKTPQILKADISCAYIGPETET